MYLLYIYVVHWKHMLISTFCDRCEKLLLNKNLRLIERYETIPSTCYAQMLLPHMSHVTVEIQMFLLSGMLPERCYSCKLLQIPHQERVRCLEVLWCLENKTASQLPMFEREKSMSWFRLPNLFPSRHLLPCRIVDDRNSNKKWKRRHLHKHPLYTQRQSPQLRKLSESASKDLKGSMPACLPISSRAKQ